MNFECGICSELLYRATQVTIEGYLKTMLRHVRLRELKRISEELGYDGGSEVNFTMIQNRFKQILVMSNQPDWVISSMFQFMRIIATPCGHTFHFWCLEEWQQYRRSMGCSTCCPYCRQFYSRANLCAIKLGQIIDTSSPGLHQEQQIQTIKVVKRRLSSTGNNSEEEIEMFSRKNFNISLAAGGDSNRPPKNGFLALAELCFKFKNVNGTKQTKEIKHQRKRASGRLRWKRFMETLKGSLKVDLVVPVLCFILSIWRIEAHVSEKKELYDIDEDNLLVEPCYFDWYFALWVLVPSWICLILDTTFLYLGELDREIALVIA